MSEAVQPVVWFDDVAGVDRDQLGGKLRSLVELTEAGFPVPPGFGVAVDAFRWFAREIGLESRLRTLSPELQGAEIGELRSVSDELSKLILEAEMPDHIRAGITAAYEELERRTGCENVPVAVRSSGVNEDLEGASFAGQYETYLWICGADAVAEHVQRCWAGVVSPEVLSYKPNESTGAQPAAVDGMSVVVQQMARSRCSGVAFTLDPVNGDRSKIVIESCWGLGEGVVKGDVTPDRFKFDKVTLDPLEEDISSQEAEYRFDEGSGGVKLMAIENGRGSSPSLGREEARAVAELAKRVERSRGGSPQDLEWAIEDGGDGPVLLQARPETVWASKRASSQPSNEGSDQPKSALDHVLGAFVRPPRK